MNRRLFHYHSYKVAIIIVFMSLVENLEFTSFSFVVTKEVIAAFSNVLESLTLYFFFRQ